MVRPGGLVVAEPRVHQRRFGAEVAGRVAALVELVHGAPHPPRSAGSDLVAQRVGQGLGRVVAGDGVAVVVEQGVQGAEAELAVAAEDGTGGAAERSARQGTGVGVGRGEGWFADGGRAPALLVRDHGPQLFAQVVGAVERGQAAARDLEDLLLACGHVVDGLVALDLQLQATFSGQAGPPPVGVECSARDGRVRAGPVPWSGGGCGQRLRQPGPRRWPRCPGRLGARGLVVVVGCAGFRRRSGVEVVHGVLPERWGR